ncbi:MAG: hypothetical protein KBG21_02600 [Ignavibacteria bacterium]|nr:hypothetical protein [Ignavibacteria bacterium]
MVSLALYEYTSKLYQFEAHVDFIEWSNHEIKDVLGTSLEKVKHEIEFLDVEEYDEVVEKIDDLEEIILNQLFLLNFSYFENFIDKYIELIFISQNEKYENDDDFIQNIIQEKKILLRKGNFRNKKKFLIDLIKEKSSNVNFEYIDFIKLIRNSLTHEDSVTNENMKKIKNNKHYKNNFIRNKRIIISKDFLLETKNQFKKWAINFDKLIVESKLLIESFVYDFDI